MIYFRAKELCYSLYWSHIKIQNSVCADNNAHISSPYVCEEPQSSPREILENLAMRGLFQSVLFWRSYKSWNILREFWVTVCSMWQLAIANGAYTNKILVIILWQRLICPNSCDRILRKFRRSETKFVKNPNIFDYVIISQPPHPRNQT